MMLVPSHEWIMDRTERIVEESEELQTTGAKCVNMFKLYLWVTFGHTRGFVMVNYTH